MSRALPLRMVPAVLAVFCAVALAAEPAVDRFAAEARRINREREQERADKERLAKAMLTKKRERHRHAYWQAFLDTGCHEVVDVTMIANDRKVLRGLLKMADAEAKVPTLESKRQFMKAMGKSDILRFGIFWI